jgi:CheY-like chemotaxis protein
MNSARDATHVLKRLTRLSHRPRGDAPRVLVDLVEVAADAIELTRPRWSRIPGVSVALAPEGKVAAFGVAAELREVLTNLILNAADALSENGSIRIEIASDSERARIRVADTGCGMTEDVLLRAFEPFFTTKGDAGTGLGLNICSAIVTAHGGRIEARSTPSRGTTLEITLPTSDDSETPRQPVVAMPLKVLVVDDDPRVLSVLADVLAGDGHEVETAASGEEALERVLGAPGPPRVLVSDISMPGMSGIHLAEEVVSRFPETAIVLVSGWAASASSETLEKLGAAVVTKPFSSSDVRSAIGRAMGRKPT